MPKEIRHVVSKQRRVRATKLRIGIENECGLYWRRTPIQFVLLLSHTTSCSLNEPAQHHLKGSMDSTRWSARLSMCVVGVGLSFGHDWRNAAAGPTKGILRCLDAAGWMKVFGGDSGVEVGGV